MLTCASTVYNGQVHSLNMVSSQPNLIGLDFILNNLPLEVTEQCSPALQLCTYFCNLSTELTVLPLVATSLLNHFEDFVKKFLSFNTSVTDSFSVPTDSHLQELSDPGTTWVSTRQSLTRSLFLPTPTYRNFRILEQPENKHFPYSTRIFLEKFQLLEYWFSQPIVV